MMTTEQRDKYAYELMVKNNSEEAVKQLLLKDKEIEELKAELELRKVGYELSEKRIKELEEEIVERAHNEYKLNETIINFHDALCNNQSIINDLRTKINKAIEYIEEYCIDDEYYINLTKKEKNIIEVLKMLKGNEE